MLILYHVLVLLITMTSEYS